MSNEARNCIVKMPFGSTISIHYKKGVSMTEATIGPSEKPHHYYALFDESDVDFKIKIDNEACKNRKMGTELQLLNERRGFVVDGGDSELLETFESNGDKFHIVSQKSSDGEVLVSLAAVRLDVKYKEASIKTGQIKFTVRYSKPFNTFKIFVKYRHHTFELQVMQSYTLAELKNKIAAELEFIPYVLSFKSLILMGDINTLENYGIGENDEICVPTEITAINIINETNIEGDSNKRFQMWFAELSSATVQQLKVMIYVEKNIPVDDQILKIKDEIELFEDCRNLGYYKIGKDSVITVMKSERVRGFGGGVIKCRKLDNYNNSVKDCVPGHEYSQITERGAVCFMGNSKQEFSTTSFIEDKSVPAISFTIEMRLISPYKLFQL